MSPFVTTSGANIEALVLALVPFNKHLRSVEGMALCPPAIAAAYHMHMKWQAMQANLRLSYVAHLAVVLSCVPPASGASAGLGAGSTAASDPSGSIVIRSHHPDDVMNESQYRAVEVGGWGLLLWLKHL
jgi:hypothetical protein